MSDKEKLQREEKLIVEDLVLKIDKAAIHANFLANCLAQNKELHQKDYGEKLVILADTVKTIHHHTDSLLLHQRPVVLLLADDRENTNMCPSCHLPMDNLSDSVCSHCSTKLPLPEIGGEPV